MNLRLTKDTPLTTIFLPVILAGLAWGVASLVLSAPLSLIIGIAAGAAATLKARDHIVVNGLVALIEPIGVILPLLILRQALMVLGMPLPSFAALELIMFLGLYVWFLVASTGLLPIDPYQLGYEPLPVAIIVLVLCFLALFSGNWFIPFAAVVAQALWAKGYGSSNWFDHILHVSLVPVALVVLLSRMIG